MVDVSQETPQRDAENDAMQDFIDWAIAEWGPPTPEERKQAEEIWSNR